MKKNKTCCTQIECKDSTQEQNNSTNSNCNHAQFDENFINHLNLKEMEKELFNENCSEFESTHIEIEEIDDFNRYIGETGIYPPEDYGYDEYGNRILKEDYYCDIDEQSYTDYAKEGVDVNFDDLTMFLAFCSCSNIQDSFQKAFIDKCIKKIEDVVDYIEIELNSRKGVENEFDPIEKFRKDQSKFKKY